MADDDWVRAGSDEHRARERRRSRQRLQPVPDPVSIADAIRQGRSGMQRAVMVTGVITRLAEKRTDHDEPWAIMEITDETGAIDVLVFPLAHARTQWNGLASGARVQVFGNVSDRPDAVPEIAAKAVSSRLPEESEGRKDA